MAGIMACENVACMASAVQTVPAAPAVRLPAAGFVSGADLGLRPAVCLCREVEEIGSTVLAGKRIFHIGSAT